MYQLFEQLKREAWNKAYELYSGEGIDNYRANLAQDILIKLVVKECAKVAWNFEPDAEISNKIKQHFGIEE